MKFILNILISTLAVLVTNYLLPGVSIEPWTTAVVVAIVLGVLNTFLKPILVFFTLPLNILTLGLFTLIINTVIVMLTSSLVPGFIVSSFLDALLFSLVLSLVNYFLTLIK